MSDLIRFCQSRVILIRKTTRAQIAHPLGNGLHRREREMESVRKFQCIDGILAHVIEREMGVKVSLQHARQFHFRQSGCGAVLCDGMGERFFTDAVLQAKCHGFGKRLDLAGGDEVGGKFDHGGMTHFSHANHRGCGGGENRLGPRDRIIGPCEVIHQFSFTRRDLGTGERGIDKTAADGFALLGQPQRGGKIHGRVIHEKMSIRENGPDLFKHIAQRLAVFEEKGENVGSLCGGGGIADESGDFLRGAVPACDACAGVLPVVGAS